MRVHTIMTAKPVVAHPNDTLDHALTLMRNGGFHHLPIMSQSKHLIGIVSSRDCRLALDVPDIHQIHPSHYPAARTIRLREIMSKAPIVTSPDADVFTATALMYENHINCLPVMLEETLIGILTSSDLLVAFIHISRNKAV
jgi:CBS domain-containing protein